MKKLKTAMDSFEKHLSKMKYQSPPDKLRDRCLTGLNTTDTRVQETQSDSVLETFWTRWLWPHPKAWAGLACIWFICFGLNHWTLPLNQISIRSKTETQTQPSTLPMSVMDYSLAMDPELDAWNPEKTNPAPRLEKDEVKPSASRKLKAFKMFHSLALINSRDQDAECKKIYS